MKNVDNYAGKIGLALAPSELEDIITCIDEVQQRMDTSRDKGWGTKFSVQIIGRLKKLLDELVSIKDKNNNSGVVYEGLPKEDCEICD